MIEVLCSTDRIANDARKLFSPCNRECVSLCGGSFVDSIYSSSYGIRNWYNSTHPTINTVSKRTTVQRNALSNAGSKKLSDIIWYSVCTAVQANLAQSADIFNKSAYLLV